MRFSYATTFLWLMDLFVWHPHYRQRPRHIKEIVMSDLNDANPTPPVDVKARLEKNAQESRKLDSPTRTNDSTIDPEKPQEDILKGFHGG